MAASAKSEMDGKIDQFCSITGVTRDIGQNMLEACAGDLAMAVNMQMEGDGARRLSGSPLSAGPSHADDLINLSDDDDVRAPIPQTEETLVDDGRMYGFRGRKRNARGVFDGFRDFQAETRLQESLRKSPRVGSLKKRTLEDLFRPPIELINRGTFAMSREKGTLDNQWLLVNIQNAKEFACQALNRDVWSNHSVRTIIKEHFVFWQVYDDSEEGRKYMQFYKVTSWPYIAVIDPRTGENMVVWNKVDAITFCDLVTEFLSLHPSLDGSSPSSPSAKKQRLDDTSIVNATEDEQMKAAIQASLSAEVLAKSRTPPLTINSDSENSELETFTDSDDSLDARIEKVVPSQKLSAKSKLSSVNTRCRSPGNKSTKNIPQKCESSGKNSTSNLSDSIRKEAISNMCKRANNKTVSPPSKGKDKCGKNSDKTKVKLDKSPSKKSPGRKSANNSDVGSGDEQVDGALNDSGSSLSSEEKNESLTHETESPKWKKYLGKSTDAESCLMIRYPDGEHERFKLPCSSQLMALVQYVIDKGYSNERFELVTNFPRRLISDLDFESTLKETGLYPQETVFVQAR